MGHKAVRYLPRGMAQYLKSRPESYATLLGMIDSNEWMTIGEIASIDNRDWRSSLSRWFTYCDHSGLFEKKTTLIRSRTVFLRRIRQDYREHLKAYLEGLQ